MQYFTPPNFWNVRPYFRGEGTSPNPKHPVETVPSQRWIRWIITSGWAKTLGFQDFAPAFLWRKVVAEDLQYLTWKRRNFSAFDWSRSTFAINVFWGYKNVCCQKESAEKTEHFLVAYVGSRDWNTRVASFWTLPSTMQVGSWYACLQPTYNKSNAYKRLKAQH